MCVSYFFKITVSISNIYFAHVQPNLKSTLRRKKNSRLDDNGDACISEADWLLGRIFLGGGFKYPPSN